MPATPHGLPYPADTEFVKNGAAAIQALAVAVDPAIVNVTALAAAPPAAPVDGELWATSPVAGVVWTFRFNAGSASPYKWEFVGGPDRHAATAGSEAGATAYPAYADLASGPSLVVARAGDYLADVTCHARHANAPNGGPLIGVGFGAAGVVADTDLTFSMPPIPAADTCLALRAQLLGVGAGDAIRVRYSAIGAGAATFSRRHLSVRPVRVA